MVVVRFKVSCKPERIEELRRAFEAVVAPSRALSGVVSFDIARDITDPHSFVATEVFVDESALQRQEALPEVQRVIALLPDVLAAEPEATVFQVSAAKAWGS
jgi:quinol monooxygenase YgiN